MLNESLQGFCPSDRPLTEGKPPVIVCHCQAVSDRVVRATIRDGAIDLTEVADRCGAGSECGGCHTRIERLLVLEQPVALRTAS
jgi:bacterioferritin-associated ferredoxin